MSSVDDEFKRVAGTLVQGATRGTKTEPMLASFRWLSLATWLTLLAVSVLTSPPADPATNQVVVKLLTGQLEGVNLSLFALFNLMGVWPLTFVVLLAFDGPEQRVWKWPFVLGSFALGAFALLPYLVLRRWGAPRRPADTWWLRAVGSRGLAVVLTVCAVALVALFFLNPERGAFLQAVGRDQFSYVMSCDFFACTVAGVLLSIEDAALRPGSAPALLSLGSVVGVPLRLIVRPRSRFSR